MANFLKLVWNEQIKLFAKKSTWVMVGMLVVLVIGAGLLTYFFSGDVVNKEYGDNWREELTAENEKYQAEMSEEEFGGMYYQLDVERNTYHLEENIRPLSYDAWQFTFDNTLFMTLISLFAIITAASIVSNEFKWGTIKLLLIRPISRWKILLSKYVSVFVFVALLVVVLLISSMLVGGILFGLNGLSPNMVMQTMNGFAEQNIPQAILRDYGFGLVSLIVMTTFAFMVSTLFRSSAMAIGLSIFLLMAGGAIVGFLSRYEWAKFILFANTNLAQYFNGNTPMIEGMTLVFSVTVLIVYLVIFIAVAFGTFQKRDVA
ncbi:ABC transporter permease [Chryseomicrobium palamuruense]|uniref:ABC transporter permease n=1 Tax=Chryseomicrobium palamuruense TaxID=682973 RepID=A0ABV8UW64_9BACL